MVYNFPYLKDFAFLKQFDQIKLKQQFVKLVVLTFNEQPIEEIQGKVISGSFNLDGTSSMRRTGNINLVANEYQNDLTKTKNLLSINKKIQVLVGFTNTTKQYTEYEILWFPLGIYLIIAANISNSINGINIALTLHDKMALLNGECGGTLPASIILNEIEDVDENGQTVISQPTIYQIIQELVNHFGGEQLGKIIISDLGNEAKEIMRWSGSVPLYCWTSTSGGQISYRLSTNPTPQSGQTAFRQDPFSYGEDVGYIYTDLTYPGDLISKAGDTICSILDQIKNVLGNYEYFYDLNGNFVFQQIKNYLNKSYSNSIITDINNNDYQVDYTSGKSVYTFEDSTIISSITNTPQFQQIKNDFVVWGKRKTLNGNEIPIRYHLAIDKKFTDEYRQDNIFTAENATIGYEIDLNGDIIQTQGYMVTDYIDTLNYNSIIVKVYRGPEPWASASYRINLYDSNKTLIGLATLQTIQDNEWLILQTDIVNVSYIRFSCPRGFENNSANALLGIKRTVFTNTYHNIKQVTDEFDNIKYVIDDNGVDVVAKDFRTDLLLSGVVAENLATNSNYYYTELQNEWGNIYDVINGRFRDEALINPENIDFFLDFIDTESDIGQYSVQNIGRRTVTIVDDTINCIFAPDIPDIVIIESGQGEQTQRQRDQCLAQGQPYSQVDEAIYNALIPSGGMKSAYDQVKKQLYQYTTFNEQVSLTTIPIYYLQPNTRITIRDVTTGIYGDFMIKSISLPIDINGTMNISCTKALKRL